MTKEQLEAKLIKAEKKAQKIKEQLKELEQPELELNKWYIDKYDKNCLIFVHKIIGSQAIFYGFESLGWTDRDWYDVLYVTKDMRPATHEEVEQALIAEAKKQGFKDEITDIGEFIGLNGLKKHGSSYVSGGDWGFFNNRLRCCGVAIFKNGKWAEIIEEPKVKINGYNMEQDGDTISFGCAKFHKRDLINWLTYSKGHENTNKCITSITLDSGVEITIEQLKQIVDNIK